MSEFAIDAEALGEGRYADLILALARKRLEWIESSQDIWPFAESVRRMTGATAQEYDGRTVLELLQNGHDALPTTQGGRLQIILDLSTDPGVLYVANDGAPFTATNLQAIINIAISDKLAGEGIGNKGLGFRSVLRLSEQPEVYSRDPADISDRSFQGYSFRFAGRDDITFLAGEEALARREQTQIPPLSVPLPVKVADPEVLRLARDGFASAIRLPLREGRAAAAAVAQVEDLFVGEVPVLLFLDRISVLDAEIRRPEGNQTFHSERTESVPRILGRRAPAWVREVDLGSHGRYLLARRDTAAAAMRAAISESVEAGQIDDSWLKWDGESWVGLAVRLDGSVNPGRIYTYLPLGAESPSPCAAHVHAPFFTRLARRTIDAGVPLNSYLMRELAQLSIDLWRLMRETGRFALVAPIVVDVAAWLPPHTQVLASVCEQLGTLLVDEPIVPLASEGRWASLAETYLWPHKFDNLSVLNASNLVRAGETIADPRLGKVRLDNLSSVHQFLIHRAMEPQASEIADWTEDVARQLMRNRASFDEWARFYDDLADVLQTAGEKLRGKQIILDDEGRLRACMGAETKRQGRAGGLFFYPSADDDEQDASTGRLPRALRRRLRYTHPDIPWNLTDSPRRKRPGRLFLENAGLVREYRTERLFDAIKELLDKNPSQTVIHAALHFVYALYPSLKDSQRARLASIAFQLPAIDGTWNAARRLFLSAEWGTPEGELLDQLISAAGEEAPAIAALANRRLAPPGSWPWRLENRDRWILFLRAIGVQDGLPLEQLRPRFSQRYGNDLRPERLTRELDLQEPLASQWTADVNSVWSRGRFPYTDYTFSALLSGLPAANEIGRLGPAARVTYAALLAAGLSHWHKDAFSVRVYRPGRAGNLSDPHDWPTPLQSYLRHTSWLPIEGEDDANSYMLFVRPDEAWASFRGEIPPYSRPLTRSIRRLLYDSPEARSRLQGLGLHVWEEPDQSGHLVRHLADLLQDGIPDHFGAQFKRQYREAWGNLVRKPTLWPWRPAETPKVVVTESGRLRSHLLAQGTSVFVPDDDAVAKRALLELTGRPILLIEPADGLGSLRLLNDHGVGAKPMSRITLEVFGDDSEIKADASLPRLIDEDRPWLATVIGLVMELKSGQFSHRSEEGLRTRMDLSRRIRITKPEAVRLMIDGSEVRPDDSMLSLPIEDDSFPTIVLLQQGSTVWEELEYAAGSLAQLIGQSSLADALRATFMALGHLLGDASPEAIDDGVLARALQVSEKEVRESRHSLHSSLATVTQRLRPLLQYWGGSEAVDGFSGALRCVYDEPALIAILDGLGLELPASAEDVVHLCRESATLANIRDQLGLDFRRFNEALAALDPPQQPLTHPDRHKEAFDRFVEEHREAILNRLREAFLSAAMNHGDLTGYCEKRILDDLAPDVAWLTEHAVPPTAIMAEEVGRWLLECGALPDLEQPSSLLPIEEARQINFGNLTRVIDRAQTLMRTWCRGTGIARPALWVGASQNRARSALEMSGLADFLALSTSELLTLAHDALGWPDGMPVTLDLGELGLRAEDLISEEDADTAERQRRIQERAQIELDGQKLPATPEHLSTLAEAVSSKLGERFLSQTGRVALVAASLRDQPLHPSGSPGGITIAREMQLSEYQRQAVGLIGEVAARAWLERRYRPDNVKWMSGFRNIVLGDEVGSDDNGYDFEAHKGRKTLYYEVKAHTRETPDVAEIQFGESEIRAAQQHSKSDAYRILFISNVLDSSSRQISELPNPLSQEGRRYYSLVGQGLRYRFRMG